MIEPVRCQVCDTVQPPATLCVTCGMRLHVPGGTPLVGDPPPEVPPGFEPTAEAAVEVGALAPPPGLENDTGRDFADLMELAPAGIPVEAGPLPGFEPTADVFERTAEAPADQQACPYCGYIQPGARVCDNCGRVRSRVAPAERAPAAAEPAPGGEPALVRCRGCGSRVPYGPRCPQCSQPLPSPD